MKNRTLFIMVLLCLVWILVITSLVGSGQDDETEYSNIIIAENDDEAEALFFIDRGDEIDISVDVKSPSGALVDVYVISSNNYQYNYPDEPFSPVVSRERVSSADFTFTVPDDQAYHIVIDNRDNYRSNDAQPQGSVIVDYSYTNPFVEEVEEALGAATLLCILGVVIVVIIIVVIIFVIIKVAKQEGPPPQPPYPPQQPYQPYPPQPYPQYPPQQPYQPPPGPPPQQPPPP